MKHRVVVTGMGVVSPIGCTSREFSEALLTGRSGVGPVTLFDPAQLRTRIAAEVKMPICGYRDRKIGFAMEAARQALEEASVPLERRREGGVSLGMGLE